MTREEVINILDRRTTIPGDGWSYEQINEAIDMAIVVLRGLRREQVERLKGEWTGDDGKKVGTIDGSPLKSATCSVCGNWLVGSDEYSCSGYFCPACGAPMTDKAVDIMMKRLEVLKDGTTD